MAKPAKTSRAPTRERILDSCRALFNDRGPDSVTTAEIAASVSINEGNLYYHFKRKELILDALYARFEAALREAAVGYGAEGGDGTERYRDYLAGWFRVMWEWRFFYRDGALVYRMAPGLKLRLKDLTNEGQQLTRRAIEEMRDAGLIRIEPKALDMLIVNAWIVATYWIEYLRAHRGVEIISRADIDWGARHVMALFRPYLTPEGLAATELGRADPRPADPPL